MTNQYRIVVVDDEKEILENYCELLQDDYQVRSFSSPQEFLASIDAPTSLAFDLLVTDLKMPGMDGIEMIRQAQKRDLTFPSILLSGFLDKESAIKAVDLGVHRLLEKPTPISTLKAAIDQLLVENDVVRVRKEIRLITSQLRELYSTLRVAILPRLPQDVLNRTVLNGASENPKKMSFEDLLEALESRLDQLLRLEKVLTGLKENSYRN